MKHLPFLSYRSIGFCLVFGITACNKSQPPPTDPPPTVYKENAYELNLLSQKLPDGRTVMMLNKTIYIKGAPLKKLIISLDTLPEIGKEEANVVEEDEDGNTMSNVKLVPKEYDVLFKVDTLDAWRKQGFSWDSSAMTRSKDSLTRHAVR